MSSPSFVKILAICTYINTQHSHTFWHHTRIVGCQKLRVPFTSNPHLSSVSWALSTLLPFKLFVYYFDCLVCNIRTFFLSLLKAFCCYRQNPASPLRGRSSFLAGRRHVETQSCSGNGQLRHHTRRHVFPRASTCCYDAARVPSRAGFFCQR